MTDNTDKLLAAISGTDLARLAIPKPHDIDKIMLSRDLTSKLQLLGKQMSKALEPQQSLMSGLAPKLTEIAKAIELQHRPQVAAFQTIAQKFQPLISQQTKFAQAFSKIAIQASPAFEAIQTMSSYNAFQRYRETFEEFGGGIDPDNVTEEEIEQTIEENQELIEEVNGVVLQAEIDGVAPGDISALIYSFLFKRVPYLSKRNYGIIYLIITTAIIFYGLYSNYSTNTTLDETVVPTLEQHTKTLEDHSKDHEEIKEGISENSEDIKETQIKVDSTQAAVGDLQEDFENYQEETDDKLDLILEEMRKQVKE